MFSSAVLQSNDKFKVFFSQIHDLRDVKLFSSLKHIGPCEKSFTVNHSSERSNLEPPPPDNEGY